MPMLFDTGSCASCRNSLNIFELVFSRRDYFRIYISTIFTFTNTFPPCRTSPLAVRDPRTPIMLAGRGDDGGVKCYLILACEIGKTLAAIGALPILDIAVRNASRIDCIDALHCGMPALVVGHARRKRKQAHRRDQHDRNHYGKTLLHQFTFGL